MITEVLQKRALSWRQVHTTSSRLPKSRRRPRLRRPLKRWPSGNSSSCKLNEIVVFHRSTIFRICCSDFLSQKNGKKNRPVWQNLELSNKAYSVGTNMYLGAPWAVEVVKWSACSPSTLTIRVQILSKVFFCNFLKRMKINKKKPGWPLLKTSLNSTTIQEHSLKKPN